MSIRPSSLAVLIGALAIIPSASFGELLKFDQTAYTVEPDKILNVGVELSPVAASGLFSYGYIVGVQGEDGIVGAVLVEPVAELNNDGPFGAGAQYQQGNGAAGLKGTIDFYNLLLDGYHGIRIGNAKIAGLPIGHYVLSISPYKTLGTNEQVFVSGEGSVLDSSMTFGESTLSVAIAGFEANAVAIDAIHLDRAKGVLAQTIRLTNTGTSSPSAFRIVVHGLPPNAQLFNRFGVTPEGLPYIQYEGTLAPGAFVNLVAEYFGSGATTTMVPTFEVVESQTSTVVLNGEATTLKPRLRIQGATCLIEFQSVADRLYWIQYSNDLVTWKLAQPAVIGTGNSVQWFDTGPPRTVSAPLGENKARFYRILLVPQ